MTTITTTFFFPLNHKNVYTDVVQIYYLYVCCKKEYTGISRLIYKFIYVLLDFLVRSHVKIKQSFFFSSLVQFYRAHHHTVALIYFNNIKYKIILLVMIMIMIITSSYLSSFLFPLSYLYIIHTIIKKISFLFQFPNYSICLILFSFTF